MRANMSMLHKNAHTSTNTTQRHTINFTKCIVDGNKLKWKWIAICNYGGHFHASTSHIQAT